MNPLGTAAVLVAGILLGALVTWRLVRRPPADEPVTFDDPPPVVPEGVSEILTVLSSSAVVVGPHDEVLEATRAARSLGLARGTRVGVPELLDLVRQARRDGQTRLHDLELSRGPSDPTLYLSARVAALADGLVVILADDLTGSHRIEATRRDFVANVSHELKTPIGAISLLAEAVEDAADDPGAVRRFAGRMGIESARLADLVSQIIDLSRLQADDPLAEPQVVDVDEVLRDAVDRCRVDAEQRGVTLTLAGAHGARVLGNARQLSTAVGNLVENAVVYSDPGARVVVAAHTRAHSDDDDVEITVSDTGIGISAADAERIFERFYRVDYGRSRANGGTGLGLSIVKHIAASHGGRVGVWSQVGRGSTFTITVPAHLAQVRAADHQGREAHPEEDDVQHAAPATQDRVEGVRS
ncbi:MAG TPA: ATP-binding protein [Friedmanniella sp.]